MGKIVFQKITQIVILITVNVFLNTKSAMQKFLNIAVTGSF